MQGVFGGAALVVLLGSTMIAGCTVEPCPGDAAVDAADAAPALDAVVAPDRGFVVDAPAANDGVAVTDAGTPTDAPMSGDGGSAPDVVGPIDAGVPIDVVAATDGAPTDVASTGDAGALCHFPVAGRGCAMLAQVGSPVTEMQVATAPPATTAGWYPAGLYVLTAATVYTGVGGASGPSGARYAGTLDLHGMGSVDYYQGVQTQPGCADVSYAFHGDTFGGSTSLHDVGWTCPPCPTCATALAYTGTLTTFTMYLPQADGSTLAQEFTVRP